MTTSRNPDGTFPKGTSGNKSGRRKAPVLPELPPNTLVPGNLDGWYSGTTGIGTSAYDKRLSHRQAPVQITYQEAITIWATDDLGRRAIQDPVEDALRPGFQIDIQDDGDFEDLKAATMARIQELKVIERLARTKCMERALGGGAILVGAKDNRPLSAPLDVTQATGIDWLTVLEPIELQPYSYYKSLEGPNADKYGQPETYMLTGFTTAGTQGTGITSERAPPPEHIIHETRLVVFPGIRVSRYQQVTNVAGAMWGESMLTSFFEPLRDLNVAYHAAALMATDVGQPVITIPGLMAAIATKPNVIRARLLALQNGRSSARAVLLDSGESVERLSGDQLAGVPEILNALAIRYAASIPMPLSRLLGQAPKALGNESDSETRFYYDDLRSIQEHEFAPILSVFARMIMQSVRKRKLPKRYGIKFNDLTRLTDAEMAQAHLTQARTDSMVIKSGMATPDEIRRTRYFGGYSFETKVDETKKAPGFVAPPPHGTPGSPTNPGAGGLPLTSHAVTSYTRKNPKSSGTEPAAKQGGDVVPGAGPNAKKDSDGTGEEVMFAGLTICIESPAGSVRKWTQEDGTQGETVLGYDYGYVKGATGADGDSVDVYLGPNEGAKWVYVVHQMKPPLFEEYDEDKALIGFSSADAAKAAYCEQYTCEEFFGGMSQMTLASFAKKIFETAGKVYNDAVVAGVGFEPTISSL